VHPYKARFSLLHKGVAFQVRDITYPELSGWVKEQTGVDRPKGELLPGSHRARIED
jgi:hypothetical protein